jgi:hypothetical protein
MAKNLIVHKKIILIINDFDELTKQIKPEILITTLI